eukprot:CAMPEP_0116006350 /NCGR_PEP_ID=MMETSP0321-20121206/1681_1 /TAXON_ID=163516 /ORGANISM="Leptocylindrus danicus var. danicus, Strain B650" /LENGTH=890 /DNA_ID=CAMNT_0003474897 /DNA_START=161 /DNA_END=2833 /DNA_ORIENTATION=-
MRIETEPTSSSNAPRKVHVQLQLPPQQPSTDVATAATITPGIHTPSSSRARIYRSSGKWATREIAALGFLNNVPLEAERQIVREGLLASSRMQFHRPSSAAGDSFRNQHSNKNENDDNNEHDDSQIEKENAEMVTSTTTSQQRQQVQEPNSTNNNNTNNNSGMRWWDKLISKDRSFFSAENRKAARRARLELEEKELECPSAAATAARAEAASKDSPSATATGAIIENQQAEIVPRQMPTLRVSSSELDQRASMQPAPGRRLEGLDATYIRPPKRLPRLKVMQQTSQLKESKRNASVREWEVQVAWGFGMNHKGNGNSGLLNGRAFFSCDGSYPIGVFSVIKYEPAREAAQRRRKKIEQMGGGGSQFIAPARDWRGISYAELLRRGRKLKKPDYFMDSSNHGRSSSLDDDELSETSSVSSQSSSDAPDHYVPGFLDDPDMVQGKHRHVMQGDKVIGPIISSTIQFVNPADLKADLNKQFRERFDGWEPPKPQRELIGAQVINGVYTLMDRTEPTEDNEIIEEDEEQEHLRSDGEILKRRKSSTASERDVEDEIRMPPSLTLSKIRNIKQEALLACNKANVEVSTVSLACVYFERLCLDCRVDKSNRRLVFAACLLLAFKINEPHVAIVNKNEDEEQQENRKWVLYSLVKQTAKSSNIFASLLEFFTHEWQLSLKALYKSEWGVFVALGFSLHATPSQVAFHFRRLMKKLEKTSAAYLGPDSYNQWKEALNEEAKRTERKEKRREARIERKERKLLALQRQLQQKAEEDRPHSPEHLSEHCDRVNENENFEGSKKVSGGKTRLWGKLKKAASIGMNMDRLSMSSTRKSMRPSASELSLRSKINSADKESETSHSRRVSFSGSEIQTTTTAPSISGDIKEDETKDDTEAVYF